MEDENVERRAPGQGRDRGGAGIARGRAQDRDALALAAQHVVEQQPHELQREILEREGWAVKQLEQVFVGAERHQRRHLGGVEAAIGGGGHGGEVGLRHRAADERRHHPRRQLGIGAGAQAAQIVGAQGRPAFRDIEPAVAGQAGQQHVLEAQHRRLAARADVADFAHVR